MEVLAIIPARGGSKGIPHKNIQIIGGQPLVAWTIIAAQGSKYITRIIVSTDNKQIKKVALKYGAEVIDRPAEISGDTASSESALLHVIEYLKQKENYQADLIVFLQATSPLTTNEDIDKCIKKLEEENADSATTVTDFHYFIWKNNENGSASGINHNANIRLRRQDREPQYLETGAVYVMKTQGFLKYKHRFFGKIVLSEMPQERVLEIDEPTDLLVAEVKIREFTKKQKQNLLPSRIKAVVLDFDGVMTNNKVYLSEIGQESVRLDRGDGMGISMLKKLDIEIAVMSTEKNPVVTARCKKLSIECFQNLGHNKFETLKKWCEEKKIELDNVVFMGNDINDIECLKNVGCSVVPSDAYEDVKRYAKIILNKKGGEGAVRELCDIIISNKIK